MTFAFSFDSWYFYSTYGTSWESQKTLEEQDLYSIDLLKGPKLRKKK